MSTSQHIEQKQLGRERAQGMIPRLVGSVLRKLGCDKLGGELYALLGNAIALGKWDDKVQSSFHAQHMPTVDYGKLCKQLYSVGYLRRVNVEGKWQAELSPQFSSDTQGLMHSALEQAPGICIPFSEVEDWKYGQRFNDLGLQLVAGKSVPSQTAIDAANALQQVQYEVNPFILWLLERNAEIEHSTTLAAQWELAKAVQDAGACRFYITFDYRFRMYYRGGLLTPQGPDWQKALFQFHAPMKLGKSGHQALALSAATAYGLKSSMEQRIQWGLKQGIEYGRQLLKTGQLVPCSDPYQFAGLAIELAHIADYIEDGYNVHEWLSHLVCHADGSCNGLQHGAALTGSREVAELTNCTAATRSATPKDAYSAASAAMVEKLSKSPAAQAVVLDAGRKAFKLPVMTVSYGAGESTCYIPFRKQILEVAGEKGLSTIGVACPDGASTTVYSAVKTVADPIIRLNAVMKKAVRQTQSTGPKPVVWKTADGCMVMQAARSKSDKDKQYIGYGEYRTRTDEIDPQAQESAIGPNFIHSIDAAHCREVVRNVKYSLVTIHDSIGCHAGSFWNCASVIRQAFATVHQHDQFASFNKYNNTAVSAPCLGTFKPEEVIKAPYFFL